MADSTTTETDDAPRVLIVSEHASVRFGGEAILPWHYFRFLRRRGIEAWLVVHSRTRDELIDLLPGEADRMHFLPDTALNKGADRLSRRLPGRIGHLILGYLSRLGTQRAARATARRLIAEYRINVVHQPILVSPREPSLLYDLGVPVVMGPMNGNMTYPPAFAKGTDSAVVRHSRKASNFANRLSPGKLQAAALLVANERTRQALPAGAKGEVITLIENGVDLEIWSPPEDRAPRNGPTRFIFLGRLVDWKAVDLLLEALARVQTNPPPVLEILGNGPMRATLEEQVSRLGLQDRVRFSGWQTQVECARRLREADALVLPSLYECGGAVVLEAMACGLPVVATAWGGPTDYLDDSCGILVPPDSREALIAGIAEGLSRLAADPELRARLGRAGRQRVEREFNWETKIDDMLAVYRRVIAARASQATPLVDSPPPSR
ncbi:MAG: glycosyltransferase family 4 protein [Paludisphaera borealis]|uniref:glycosyltransferase family 4 protein n=1 Tax=Paludisphaera borealis TaxID=1387353 RepID=UPI00284EB615|nr:glycosyltransferase family 4 protein [Paludisphaera borealis]MDR3622225.1 glycosyltransferase family 4 protein [Paludisphaera borealis]